MKGHGGVSIADEGSETNGRDDASRRTDGFGGENGYGEIATTDEADDDSRGVATATTTTDRRRRDDRGDPHPSSSSAETGVRSSADADLKMEEGGNGPERRRPGSSVPFVEVIPPTGGGTSEPPEWVEAYVCRLSDPKSCSALVKDLAELLPLRRGERRSKKERGGKKGRGDAEDEVLIREVAEDVDGAMMVVYDDDDPSFVDLGHLRRIRRTAIGDTVGARAAEKAVCSATKGKRSGDADAAEAATGDEASAERDTVEVGGKTNEASSSPSPTPTMQDQPPSHRKKKRRRGQRQNGETPSPVAANATSTTLEVLLGSVRAVSSLPSDELERRIFSRYPLSRPPEIRLLPGRPPRSHDDFVAKTEAWPLIHFPKNTEEHRAEERRLSEQDVECMSMGMVEAVRDARASRGQYEEAVARRKRNNDRHRGIDGKEDDDHEMETPSWMTRLGLGGAVVLCPRTKRVLSRSSDERAELIELMAVTSRRDAGNERPKPVRGDCDEGNDEEEATTTLLFPDVVNPTCTPVLLALQGVSRRERAAALGSGMESDEFRNGQYLCTGLDVYTTVEPSVFEAMAMVHSRVGRAVFGVADNVDGGLGGAGMDLAVHSLPGINHHYRVFKFDEMHCASAPGPMSYVYEECTKLHFNAAFREGPNVGGA